VVDDASDRTGSLRLVRANRPRRLLWTARTVSFLGDSLSLIALMLYEDFQGGGQGHRKDPDANQRGCVHRIAVSQIAVSQVIHGPSTWLPVAHPYARHGHSVLLPGRSGAAPRRCDQQPLRCRTAPTGT